MVCKHLCAALTSVSDPNLPTLRRLQAADEAEQKRRQDLEVPGERARLEEGLDKLDAEDVVRILKGKLKTVEGLRLLSEVFDKQIMPARKCEKCLRCGDEFDSRFKKERICRVPHPYSCVNTEWASSKVSWDHCTMCDKDFHKRGGNKRGWDDDEKEDGEDYCFEGEHTTDQSVVDEEKEIYGDEGGEGS